MPPLRRNFHFAARSGDFALILGGGAFFLASRVGILDYLNLTPNHGVQSLYLNHAYKSALWRCSELRLP